MGQKVHTKVRESFAKVSKPRACNVKPCQGDTYGSDFMKPFAKIPHTLVLVALLLCSGCALQRDVDILDRRLTGLHRQVSQQEERLNALEAQVAAQMDRQAQTGDTLRNKQADLGSLLNRIRDELKELRGRLEENEYRTARQSETWENTEAEMKNDVSGSLDRIVRLEQYLSMEPSEKLQPEINGQDGQTNGAEAPDTPDALYLKAKEQFDKGKYEVARNLFERFLERYGESEKADNAQFWIGEIYYREKWYEKAILEYQKVIETYPKGNKVRSALLKQGLAFLNLGDEDNARLILKELVRKHPDSSEAKIAAERLERF